jgi:hypothetical protein
MLHRYDQWISSPKLLPNYILWFQQDGAMAHMAVIKQGCISLFISKAGDFSLQWCDIAFVLARPNSNDYFL